METKRVERIPSLLRNIANVAIVVVVLVGAIVYRFVESSELQNLFLIISSGLLVLLAIFLSYYRYRSE
jgi:high-affinity Fe2+/Pb2+ permease